MKSMVMLLLIRKGDQMENVECSMWQREAGGFVCKNVLWHSTFCCMHFRNENPVTPFGSCVLLIYVSRFSSRVDLVFSLSPWFLNVAKDA